jgi:hypothetical protein
MLELDDVMSEQLDFMKANDPIFKSKQLACPNCRVDPSTLPAGEIQPPPPLDCPGCKGTGRVLDPMHQGRVDFALLAWESFRSTWVKTWDVFQHICRKTIQESNRALEREQQPGAPVNGTSNDPAQGPGYAVSPAQEGRYLVEAVGASYALGFQQGLQARR